MLARDRPSLTCSPRRVWLTWAACALSWSCAGAPGTSRGSRPSSARHELLGRALPAFGRPALDGPRFETSAGAGRVTVVKFFARYCEPCKRTLPATQQLHARLPEVLIVGVSEDETEDDARQLVATYRLTFPVVLDRGNALAGRFRVTDMPVTFVANRAGNVAWVGGPDQSEADLEAAVRSLL